MDKSNQVIVCAACRHEDVIFAGPRHYDAVMHSQIKKAGLTCIQSCLVEQGFINQFGEFLTRVEAMEVVKKSGQPFDIKRNGGYNDRLFSEGLY